MLRFNPTVVDNAPFSVMKVFYSLDKPYWYLCLLVSLTLLYYIYVEIVQTLITIAFPREASTLDRSGNFEEQVHHFNDSWCWLFVHFFLIVQSTQCWKS